MLENEAEGPMDDEPMADEGAEACLDPVLLAAARELRRPVALDASLDARIMAAVHAEGSPAAAPTGLTAEWTAVTPASAPAVAPAGGRPGAARRRATALWEWLREPRTLRVSPLGGFAGVAGLAAAAAVVVALLPGGPERGAGSGAAGGIVAAASSPAGPPAAAPVRDTVQVVQFVLVAPEARSVALVGDFNDWDAGATPLRAAGTGRRVWSVEVPLEPGRHRYAFVVDGEEWVPDPAAPRAAGADFGAPSSVVTVVEHRS